MSGKIEKPCWQLWLTLSAALFGLNVALSFHNAWPTPWVTLRYELSVEVAALVLLMALYSEWRQPPSRRALGWLVIVFTMLVLGRYAQVTALALYGRPVNLFWDVQHLPQVVAMLAETAPGWLVLLTVIGVAALLAAIVLALRWMLTRISDAFVAVLPRRIVIVLGSVLVALFAVGHVVPQMNSHRWFSLPVTLAYAQQLSFLHQALIASDTTLGVDAPPLASSSLKRVAGADVIVLFLESYGAATFDRPEYARALVRSRNVLRQAVASSGRRVTSAYVRSPTFGGASWLAHASFLSGVEVADERTYRLLLTGKRETLVHRFARHGYRTLALMPGLRWAWPEGEFYRFDKIYDAAALEYHGPEFGFWRIPDQYTLARFDAIELATPVRAPVMVLFATINSHWPFQPMPPYLDDWQALLESEPFGPDDVADRFIQTQNWSNLAPSLTNRGPSYVGSIDYALTYIAGYLESHAPTDLVLVVLGDHQPVASISGLEASWDVPVHVIASRPEIIDALHTEGFQPGLEPSRPVLGPMHTLTDKILRAFDGDAASPTELAVSGSGLETVLKFSDLYD